MIWAAQTARDGVCPICGSHDETLLQRQSLDLIGPGRTEFAVTLCRTCGFIRQNPQVRPDLLEQFRARMTDAKAQEPEADAAPSGKTQRLLRLLRGLRPTPGTLYELGCGTGANLTQYRRAGWSVGGCDASPASVAIAWDTLGIRINCGTEATELPKKHNLDVVILADALECSSDPVALLERAHKALAPGGHVLLDVPCAVAPHKLPPGWFTLEHLSYFSPETLENLLAKTGFEPQMVRINQDAFIYPVISVMAKRRDDIQARRFGDPLNAIRFADSYMERERGLWADAEARLPAKGHTAYIWGAGIHTAQLFDRTDILDRLNILGIVDADPQKWQGRQAGIPVVSPDAFFAMDSIAPIVVSSYYGEPAILDALLARGIPESRIVTLYPERHTRVGAPQSETRAAVA